MKRWIPIVVGDFTEPDARDYLNNYLKNKNDQKLTLPTDAEWKEIYKASMLIRCCDGSELDTAGQKASGGRAQHGQCLSSSCAPARTCSCA
jgi:hypothetical protein